MQKRMFGIGAMLGLVCLLSAAPAAIGADDDMTGIKKQCEAYVAAFNRHDAKGMAAVFAEDGDMMDPAGHLVKGRAAIEKALAADHAGTGAMRESKLVVKEEPIRMVTPDVAVSDALVSVEGAYGPDGKKAGTITLAVHNVWKKSGGAWSLFASRVHVRDTQSAPS